MEGDGSVRLHGGCGSIDVSCHPKGAFVTGHTIACISAGLENSLLRAVRQAGSAQPILSRLLPARPFYRILSRCVEEEVAGRIMFKGDGVPLSENARSLPAVHGVE